MPKRSSFDEAEDGNRRKGGASPDFGLWGQEPRIPELRTPLPVAPGSDTSAEAAETVDRQAELQKVLVWFAAQSEPRTTHECAAVLYPETGTGSACPRVHELVFLQCLERVGRQGKRATLRITSKGRAKAEEIIARRNAA